MSTSIQSPAGVSNPAVPPQTPAARKGASGSGAFQALAAEAARSRTDTFTGGLGAFPCDPVLPAGLMMDLANLANLSASQTAGAAGSPSAEAPAQTEAVSLESMLEAKYPGIHYHVFDASSGHWRTRTDYPHYLLYQDGDKAKETLEHWEPKGENPFYGSIDGRFIAPPELRALGSVPPGSKAVVIHPKVQERMEQDPAYAREIFDRIDAWFAFDKARNEAILPGSTWDMSQAVAIGEDGSICNACSSSPGGEITFSRSGGDGRRPSWWDLRMARHAEFMRLLREDRIQHQLLQSAQLSAAADARAALSEMMRGTRLQEVFGPEIAGVPTSQVLAITQAQVFGGGGLL